MAEYKDINELYQYWESNDVYPDYVCGVWSTSGGIEHLTVAVNSEEAKGEILSLIENDSSVAFAYQKYSKNYLLSIIDEMNGRFSKLEYAEKTGFSSMGLNEYNNCVEISLKKGFEDNALSLELVNELTERFGDAVSIDYTDDTICCTVEELVLRPEDFSGMKTVTYSPTVSASQNSTVQKSINESESNLSGVCFILSISVLLLIIAFILQRKRVLSLACGGTRREVYSKNEVEDIVKNNILDTSCELDERVMKFIDKK